MKSLFMCLGIKKAGKTTSTDHTLVKYLSKQLKPVGALYVNRKHALELKHVKAVVGKFGDGNLVQLQMAT